MASAITEPSSEPSSIDPIPAEPRFQRPPLGPFLAALVIGWIALSLAAWSLAGVRRVPSSIALPVALGFLTEYSFYLLLGFGDIRLWLSNRFTRTQLSAGIACSAFLPYFVYSAGAGVWKAGPGLALAAIMAATAFWFLPRIPMRVLGAVRDLAFLTLLAAIIISGVLARIMPAPVRHVPMEVLGHISLVRAAILAVLLVRGADETGIGFIPRWRDLRIGFLCALGAGAIALPLGLRLGQLRLSGRMPSFWPSLGLLLGVFWVLALSEEFFFRALLQRWIARWTQKRGAGLVIASLLFGVCHLGWSRSVFPNWRYALLAAILGFFCGVAFLQARSVRASMVTHALLVSAWRLFFS